MQGIEIGMTKNEKAGNVVLENLEGNETVLTLKIKKTNGIPK